MNTEAWHILSDWHSTWLAAAIDERDDLRAAFAIAHPELIQAADDLAAASGAIDGFLETPAMVLAARELAEETPTLPEGTQVGPYRIVALLARGGMGDVYRATDLRLGRDVALKTLADAAGGGDGVERFLQEARVTASLDHPNIVRVFDVGMSGARPFLVSELLDGETLRATIDRGPVAPESTRAIACAVASGLAAAHARGLVHRDLKPENIFVTRSGSIKILDFGIAKLAQDPALPRGLATLTGVLLGTAGYLAPEQVRGEAVDARTDLFALGSILFELITGQRAFVRAHTIDTLHAIVHDDPPELLPASNSLTAIATRLLAKAPRDRFQSAGDLQWYLERLEPSDVQERSKPLPKAGEVFPFGRAVAVASAVALVVILSTLAGGRLWQSPQHLLPAADLIRFTWSLPEGSTLDSAPIVSPDGRRIAFTAVERDARPRLFVRSFDSPDATAIAGTDGAMRPFWSPDGTAIGYFAGGRLMRVAVAGGVPVAICDAPGGMGGAWSPNGTIVFSPRLISEGLARVSASGGPVEPATLLDMAHGENSHRWPTFLPDGIHFLFHVRSSTDERRGVYIGRIDQPATTPGVPVFRSESAAMFVATSGRDRGVLLSPADGHVQARPFDASTLKLEGDPRSLPVMAAATTPYHAAMLGATSERLATVAMPVPFGGQLGIVARDGRRRRLLERCQQNWPRLSPDDTHVARQLIDPLQGNPDIWLEDIRDGSLVRVSTDLGSDMFAVWSPDGSRLAYASGPLNERRLSIAAADGTGILNDLPCPDAYCEPTDWLPDGRGLIVNARRTAGFTGAGDIWRVSLDAGGHATAILAGPFPEYDARLSSDGRWLAYVSEDGGRPDVFIRAMTGQPRRLVVSSNGGSQPVWRRDGREILYVDREGRLQARAVDDRPDGGLRLGATVALDVPRIGAGHWGTQYDVSRDGQLVYFIDRTLPAGPNGIEVVIGWRALLK
jgi:eukaryotic-like serine/threonine-protein kinase